MRSTEDMDAAMVEVWRFGDRIEIVKDALSSGGVVAIPTESSYALAVDPRCAEGVEAVYAIKRRDGRKPLPIVVASSEQAEALMLDVESAAFAFGLEHWPAPLTMLVPLANERGGRAQLQQQSREKQHRRQNQHGEPSRKRQQDQARQQPVLALGPLDLVAVRIPALPELLSLLVDVGHGLTATSANLAGQVPLLTTEAVHDLLAGARLKARSVVVKTAPLLGGAPSTMVAWRDGALKVVRQGRFVL